MRPEGKDGRLLVPLLIIDEASQASQWLEGRTKLTKLVYIAQQLAPGAISNLAAPERVYHFRPYRHGPYSRDLIIDLRKLELRGLIDVSRRALDSNGQVVEYLYRITPTGGQFLRAAEEDADARQIRGIVHDHAHLSRSELVRLIYKEFPEAIR